MSKTKICKGCGAEIYKGLKKCPQCGKRNKGHTGIIVVGIVALLLIIASLSSKTNVKNNSSEKTEYTWPSMGIAVLLPEPGSKYGKIISDSDNYFSMEVYQVSKSDFNDYVAECKDRGFIVDYSASDSHYYADDTDGNSLSLLYDTKDEEMSIHISRQIEESTEKSIGEDGNEKAETETQNDLVQTTSSDSALDTENGSEELTEVQTETVEETEKTEEADMSFRAWVDSYEEFMNQYVDFMLEYQKSDGTDIALVTRYSQLMIEYAEFIEETDKINEDSLSVSDYAYYTEAQARITKRLSEI